MYEYIQIILGILIPFFGTALGAAAVFFSKKDGAVKCAAALFGAAAGVMLASSVWSLLIPALAMPHGVWQSAAGFLAGTGLFLGADLLLDTKRKRPKQYGPGEARMMSLAVTLHNVPEGMAVGVAVAGGLAKGAGITMAAAMALSIGIALQNIPEGAVISLPLRVLGQSRKRAFRRGVMSGAVEPVGAVAALVFTRLISSMMPFVLSFAAGAMIYVIIRELIPAYN